VTYIAPHKAAVEISNLDTAIEAIKGTNRSFLKLLQENPKAENLTQGLNISADGTAITIYAGAHQAVAKPRVVLVDNSALMEYCFDVQQGDEVITLLKLYLTRNGLLYESPVRGVDSIGDVHQPEVGGIIVAAVQLAALHSKLYEPRQ
jgi:hypothetical protein